MSEFVLFNNKVSGNNILLPIAGKKVVGIKGFNNSVVVSTGGTTDIAPPLSQANQVYLITNTYAQFIREIADTGTYWFFSLDWYQSDDLDMQPDKVTIPYDSFDLKYETQSINFNDVLVSRIKVNLVTTGASAIYAYAMGYIVDLADL